MKVKAKILPKSRPGRWSIGLIAAMPVLFVTGALLNSLLYESAPAGSSILQDIVARPALVLAMLAGIAAGVSAFVAGLVAIVWQKERSLSVYGATLLGALFLLLLLGEVSASH